MNVKDASLKNIGNAIKNAASDLLTNSDFLSRTIGMTASYDDIMFIVQSLGREPISLLGKDYPFIFDHVRRNYQQGVSIPSMMYGGGEYGCAKFTFYKEKPTVRFADPYQDPLRLLDRWMPNMNFETTAVYTDGGGTSIHYSESNDGVTNNKKIGYKGDLDGGNPGTFTNSIYSYGPELSTCDLIKKTNDNFNHGKYKTLVARFHTNSDDSRKSGNPTQTAKSNTYGLSHGRNLLKPLPTMENGYDNPYCRVWTYHHQYNQIGRMIRPIGDIDSADALESAEMGKYYGDGGFRTIGNEDFEGGSGRLDKYGVLNYRNGFVNIAPTAKITDYFHGKENDEKAVSTKKCMFSIENLAWRDDKMRMDTYDQQGLSPEQKGPLGGRIMWFPPYDLQFNEDVSVNWNNNQFIGRGEGLYTYTNTERRGNLSFTLIIDHPSILDYWTSHKRNGQSNMGKSLIDGNGGGVDEIWNQENTLLRFFAGCQVLTAKPQEFEIPSEGAALEKKEDPTPEPEVPGVEETKTKTPKKLQVLLFYPNNYSGVDDRNNPKVNPIYYLMNGIGTQREVIYEAVSKTYKAEDFTPVIDQKLNNGTSSFEGGYEMNNNRGISFTDKQISWGSWSHDTIASSFTPDKKAEYLTDESGNTYIVAYGSNQNNHTLAKIVGQGAEGLDTASGSHLSGKTHSWYQKRYYYRVDKEYETDVFTNSDSYLDVNSHRLNGSNYSAATSIKEFGIEADSDTFKLYSFSDLFAALETSNKVIPNTEKSKELKKILTDKERYEITRLKYFGHASYQGTKNANNKLAKNRAYTLKTWLEGFEQFKGIKSEEPVIKNQTERPVINVGHNSEMNTKLWRSASVIIEYDELSVSNAAETKTVVQTDKDGNVVTDTSEKNSGATLNKVDKKEIPNGKTSNKTNNLLSSLPKGGITNQLANSISDEEIYKLGQKIRGDKLGQEEKTENPKVQRYDNEGEFFELLDKESPFLHHLITDKIKYFDPAFHSISPEGFNARLTFLHQCTRQGSTIENGNPNQITAYNLAFGRPPVCVLRVGDFYNTKIIINSLSIQYETPQWDLNPEGIGVMPMFAKININFTFLGGSDLAGPIARLQNAVSFNYYANASVYDNRAETVEYDPNGSGRVAKFKGYVYPNLQAKKGGVYIGDVRTTSDQLDAPNMGNKTYMKGNEG